MSSDGHAIRVLLVDDHPFVREGIRSFLSDQPEFNVVGEASTGEEAIRMTGEHRPASCLPNLDDPGAGLRQNDRQVLTYADLRTMGGTMDQRAPGREIELHLTGNMERFVWSLDGVKLNDAKPIHFVKDERLRITLVNDSTMAHPMHLHGMPQTVIAKNGYDLPQPYVADTILVAPGERVDVLVDATELGLWAFHSHILTHAEGPEGMFGMVTVMIVQ